MKISENVSLSDLTTMRTGGIARYVLMCENRDDIRSAIKFANEKNLPWFVLGGGSNLVAINDFDGVIILNRIRGFNQIDDTTFRIGAGENWDEIVAKLCKLNLSGIECLSLIPGVAGAFPVQNVGAYGQEISQVLIELTVFDVEKNEFVILKNADCKFTYRDSIFKSKTARKYIICDLTLRLNKEFLKPPFYRALAEFLDQNDVTDFSPQSIRDAVIEIRKLKLPHIDKAPNVGSFFKNPIVDQKTAQKKLSKFADAPHWKMPDNKIKLSAGWMIDRTGLKGYKNHGFQIYPKNALVITNVENSTAENLIKFRAEIIDKVYEVFAIRLEQEPEEL